MRTRWNERARLHTSEPGVDLEQHLRHKLQYGGGNKTASCLADLLVEMREGNRGEPSEPSPYYEHHGDGVEKSSLAGSPDRGGRREALQVMPGAFLPSIILLSMSRSEVVPQLLGRCPQAYRATTTRGRWEL